MEMDRILTELNICVYNQLIGGDMDMAFGYAKSWWNGIILLILSALIVYACDREDELVTNKRVYDKNTEHTPMVMIPAGEFQMGSAEGDDDEEPVHTVYLDAFYMDIYEVTNAQYYNFVEAIGHRLPEYWMDDDVNAPDQPVSGVSWYDAKAYADWVGKRLPTEAEWEKAARGGLDRKQYPWGDAPHPPTRSGNFADEMGKEAFLEWDYAIAGYDDGYAYTAAVGSFMPNDYGLHDMAGNVSEWCADWYSSDYYGRSPRNHPKGPVQGIHHVMRGGSWLRSLYELRVANRYGFYSPLPISDYEDTDSPIDADIMSYGVGFRCASDADSGTAF